MYGYIVNDKSPITIWLQWLSAKLLWKIRF